MREKTWGWKRGKEREGRVCMYVDVLHAHAEQNACTHLTVCMHVLLCTITFRDTETKIADMPKGRKECTAFVLADRIWVVCLLSLPESLLPPVPPSLPFLLPSSLPICVHSSLSRNPLPTLLHGARRILTTCHCTCYPYMPLHVTCHCT